MRDLARRTSFFHAATMSCWLSAACFLTSGLRVGGGGGVGRLLGAAGEAAAGVDAPDVDVLSLLQAAVASAMAVTAAAK